MSTFLAHPSVFSDYAVAADADADLRQGTHLRLFPSTSIGFPIAPFALWEMPAQPVRALPFTWFDRHRQPLAELNLDQADGEAIGWLTAILPDQARLIGVEARFPAGPGEIAILDKVEDRVIATRSAERLLVGAPMITRLRLRGRGPVTLLGWAVTPDAVLERIVGSPPFGTLGLPIADDAPWYANGEGPDVAWQRIGSGAPRRWTRPDRPDGPFDPLAPAAEEARVTAFREDLDRQARRLVKDPEIPPAAVVGIHEVPASIADGTRRPWQKATLKIQNALLLKALDTGAGRYLGLMTVLRHLPEDHNPFGATSAWLAAGAFACRRRLPPTDALEVRVIERLDQLFPGLARIIDLARHGHRDGFWVDDAAEQRQVYQLEIRAFVAPALAAPPPDLLGVPDVRLGPAQWLREPEGPSNRFRQQFLVKTPPLAALAALGRLEAGAWTSRHEMMVLASGAEPPAGGGTLSRLFDGCARPRHSDRRGRTGRPAADACRDRS